MSTGRKIAIIVGVLFIIGTAAGMLAAAFAAPSLADPDYLSKFVANENQIMAGALLMLVMGFALALIPALMFPLLKKQNEPLAVSYVVFRGALETIITIATAVVWLLLLSLSQEYVQAGASAASSFQTLGALLLAAGHWMQPMLVLAFGLGALMLYTLLYQSKLIPRWLSVWGLIAAAMHLITAPLTMFGLLSSFSPLEIVLNLPIFLQEMVMAVWLIVKGFSASPIAAESVAVEKSKRREKR